MFIIQTSSSVSSFSTKTDLFKDTTLEQSVRFLILKFKIRTEFCNWNQLAVYPKVSLSMKPNLFSSPSPTIIFFFLADVFLWQYVLNSFLRVLTLLIFISSDKTRRDFNRIEKKTVFIWHRLDKATKFTVIDGPTWKSALSVFASELVTRVKHSILTPLLKSPPVSILE